MSMKFRVLVIDDNLTKTVDGDDRTRKDCYLTLNDQFDVVFLERPDELEAVFRREVIHAVLLDFVLDNWNLSAEKVLQFVSPNYVVCLISNHWGGYFNDLRHTISNYEIAQIFNWRELEDLDKRHLITLWIQHAVRKRHGLSANSIGDDESLKILQLSDLHFGARRPDAFASETLRAAQEVRRHWGSPPHFVALTGDLTEGAFPDQYSQAKEWLTAFGTELDANWSNERFLLIPGNHDICLPLGGAARVFYDAKKEKLCFSREIVSPDLKKFSLNPFRDFATELLGNRTWDGERQFWVNGDYRHVGIILFGYNTCELVDDNLFPERIANDSTVSAMFSEIHKFKREYPSAVVVGLMHHPFTANDPNEALRKQEIVLKNISPELGGMITLHGHAHTELTTLQLRSGIPFLEITAGSVAKLASGRPEDSLRGFNMIELVRKVGRVEQIVVSEAKFESLRISIGEQRKYTIDTLGRPSWTQ